MKPVNITFLDIFKKRPAAHLLFCCSLILFFIYMLSMGLSTTHAIYGFALILVDVYVGRLIWKISASGGNWFDLFCLYFLCFFFLSLIGLAGFVRFVEPNLNFSHYIESLINISVLTQFSLSFGFFATKIRKNIPKKSSDLANHSI